jgi:hypothetical protein
MKVSRSWLWASARMVAAQLLVPESNLQKTFLNHNCDMVLLEHPFDASLLFDLNAQCMAPNRTFVEDYIKNTMFASGGEFLRLFDWTRDFNLKSEPKVHVIGIALCP